MTRKQQRRIGAIVILIIAALFGLSTLWTWAYHGMSKHVGLSSGVTTAGLVVIAIIVILIDAS